MTKSDIRLTTGLPRLDESLGGGLLSGSLTIVVGATGIGKTQLGLQFAAAGADQEGHRGVLFDMSRRGDSQGHERYAGRLCDWQLQSQTADRAVAPEQVFDSQHTVGDYLHVFDQRGSPDNRRRFDFDAHRATQAELNRKLDVAIAFFYSHFIRGVRRVVVDGIDPTSQQNDSIQFELFAYLYEQIVRKDAEWLARDMLRQRYREYAAKVEARTYDAREIGCLMLYTSHESRLDQLIDRPLEDEDWLAAANTVIYMGKLRQTDSASRGLYIAKHRGSACSDEVIPFAIGEQGLCVI